MAPGPVHNAVQAVVSSVRDRPNLFPINEIADLQRTGHDVQIDTSGDVALVFVERRPAVDLSDLTPRQREVAMLTLAGMSNRQIAVTLSISIGTVKDHVHAVLDKTGMDSRGRLIAAWFGAHQP